MFLYPKAGDPNADTVPQDYWISSAFPCLIPLTCLYAKASWMNPSHSMVCLPTRSTTTLFHCSANCLYHHCVPIPRKDAVHQTQHGFRRCVRHLTLGFFPSLANKARSRSCEGGATNIIYGFKSELRSVFSDCKYRITYLTVPGKEHLLMHYSHAIIDNTLFKQQLYNILTATELTVTAFRVQASFPMKFIFQHFSASWNWNICFCSRIFFITELKEQLFRYPKE